MHSTISSTRPCTFKAKASSAALSVSRAVIVLRFKQGLRCIDSRKSSLIRFFRPNPSQWRIIRCKNEDCKYSGTGDVTIPPDQGEIVSFNASRGKIACHDIAPAALQNAKAIATKSREKTLVEVQSGRTHFHTGNF